MKIRFVKALWGMTGTLTEQIERIAAAGYDGIECGNVMVNEPEFKGLVKGANLLFVPMLFVETAEQVKAGLESVAEFGPTLVNVHAGKDWYSFDEGCAFFEKALEYERQFGVQLAFETHRGRILFHPKTTAAYLRRFPELKLTADFSHFTNVCESLLADQQADLQLCIERARHTHARVGHEQGCQVNDPRTPDNEPYVQAFEKWWDAIKTEHEKRGEEVMFVDPEFGPPNYMPTVPFTQQPVTDLWTICLWMANRLRKRWDA